MPTLDIPIRVSDAMLKPDGSVALQLLVGAESRATVVVMPPSPHTRPLVDADGGIIFLALDELPQVAPALAREISAFVGELRRRLTVRMIGGA